jgi:hypothetical protein
MIDSNAAKFFACEIKPFAANTGKRTQDRASFLRRMAPIAHNGLALMEGGLAATSFQASGRCWVWSCQKGEVRLEFHDDTVLKGDWYLTI